MDWSDSRKISGFAAETLIAVLAYYRGKDRLHKVLEGFATPAIEHLWTYAQAPRDSAKNNPRLWFRRVTEAHRACGNPKNAALRDCAATAEAIHFGVEIFDYVVSHTATPFFADSFDMSTVMGAFRSAAAQCGLGDFGVAKVEARWRFKDYIRKPPEDAPDNLQAAFEALWIAGERDAAKRLLLDYCGKIREGNIQDNAA
jgi:hypothetical protein